MKIVTFAVFYLALKIFDSFSFYILHRYVTQNISFIIKKLVPAEILYSINQ